MFSSFVLADMTLSILGAASTLGAFGLADVPFTKVLDAEDEDDADFADAAAAAASAAFRMGEDAGFRALDLRADKAAALKMGDSMVFSRLSFNEDAALSTGEDTSLDLGREAVLEPAGTVFALALAAFLTPTGSVRTF